MNNGKNGRLTPAKFRQKEGSFQRDPHPAGSLTAALERLPDDRRHPSTDSERREIPRELRFLILTPHQSPGWKRLLPEAASTDRPNAGRAEGSPADRPGDPRWAEEDASAAGARSAPRPRARPGSGWRCAA